MEEERHIVVEAKDYGEILRFIYQKDFKISDLSHAVEEVVETLHRRFPVSAGYHIKIYSVFTREEAQKLEDIL